VTPAEAEALAARALAALYAQDRLSDLAGLREVVAWHRDNAVTAPERSVDEAALTAAHLAVEDALVELRDARVGVIGPANGFVVREKDGTPSRIMRLGTRAGLRIAIEAYLSAVFLSGHAIPNAVTVPGRTLADDAREHDRDVP
jgi:hypothetical protein